jgi:hypothetical protein
MASVMLQIALDAETREYTALQNAARVVCDALKTQRGGSRAALFEVALPPSMVVCVSGYVTPSILA